MKICLLTTLEIVFSDTANIVRLKFFAIDKISPNLVTLITLSRFVIIPMIPIHWLILHVLTLGLSYILSWISLYLLQFYWINLIVVGQIKESYFLLEAAKSTRWWGHALAATSCLPRMLLLLLLSLLRSKFMVYHHWDYNINIGMQTQQETQCF